jgi:serine/threonine-protein kinase
MLETVIADRYRLGRIMGEGGMGRVYEGVDTKNGRRVAVKVLSSDLVSSDPKSQRDLTETLLRKRDELLTRFEREARSTGAIEAENVVQVFAAGTDDRTGKPYIVMEFLIGEDLHRLMRRVGPLVPDAALRIVAQGCAGLAKAHEVGVVHRDIKTANLFLAEGDKGRVVVKLLDFGIAKLKQDQAHVDHTTGLTQTGGMLGSPQYMSPEQAQGLRTVDHRTDIWSLGVVLYKTLSGEIPFHGETVAQLLLAICTTKPTPLQDVAPWVTPGLASIVHRALRREPKDRFESASAMLDAIEAELHEAPALTRAMLVPLPEELRRLRPPRRVSDHPSTLTFGGARSGPSDASASSTEAGVTKGTRSSRRTGLRSAALIALGGAALAAGLAYRRQPPPTTLQDSPVADPSRVTESTAGTAPDVSPTASARGPALKTVRLAVEPATASVEIDGTPVNVTAGSVEIAGPLLSVRRVRVRSGRRERVVEVTITEEGAVPGTVSAVDPSAAPTPRAGTRTGGATRPSNASPTAASTPTSPSKATSNQPGPMTESFE